MSITVIVLITIACYLLGSIPTGLLVGYAKGVDIRQHGSGNIGATNVFRTLGRKLGIFVFICDVLKGVLGVVIGRAIYAHMNPGDVHAIPPMAGILGAIACILGHNFPVWLKFKGGKGVATSLGMVIGLVPIPAAITFALWLAILFASGYVSLASIIAALSVPVSVALLARPEERTTLVIFFGLAAFLIVLRHKANIKRLLNGTESSFKKSKKA